MNNYKIAVIGLGYVGLPLAVEFGKKYEVLGFDTNIQRINDLNEYIDKTLEVSESEIKDAIKLKFSSEPVELQDANIYIVTVPTPVDAFNRPDLTPLVNATESVAGFLKNGDIVIYESTVYPGCTEEICVPILESRNRHQLKFNEHFFCGYSPERINPGDKSRKLTSIKKITSGSTPEIANFIDILYSEIIDAGTFKASSIRVAEAAKVIENSQRDINIAYMNELSIIFNLMDIDTNEVIEAASTKWNFLKFTPGLVGGHCIGVDPYYLTHKAQELGYKSEIILSGRRINDNMPSYAVSQVIKKMVLNGHNLNRATVGILGVTFKENCPDIRNSKAFDLIFGFKEWGIKVLVSDPLADADAVLAEYGVELTDISNWRNLNALIIAVPHLDYFSIAPKEFSRLCSLESKPIFADLKAVISKEALAKCGFDVFRL